ncbi:MAG: transcriptional regulator [Thermoplasmatales archaeon SG8-52-3]|nr:MAG: transcriptional regulator [Thermoplasmatales archaeon SG8-52-3]
MIEITTGTLEERIIKLLKKTYPISVDDIKNELNVSKDMILRTLKKFQMKGIVRLEPLSDKTYVRLLRHDFSFIGKKRQRKFIKHRTGKRQESNDYDGIMYS